MTPDDIERLYRDCGHVVLRRARSILGDEDAAREVLHEVFLTLLEKPGQFKERSTVTTWLYSVTTHRCLNRLRNYRTRQALTAAHIVPNLSAQAPARAEQQTAARQLLGQMPREIAQAAVYYFMDDMTQDEIAAALGSSRRRVGKLFQRLKLWLEETERA